MIFFITGVGSGIGRETCNYVLSNGHSVIGVLRKKEQAESLIQESKSLSGKLTLLFADLSELNFANDFSSFLVENKFQHIDVLINVAGVLSPMELDEFDLPKIERVMNVNFIAPALLIKVLKPFMVKSENANIINITSMSGFQGSVRFPGLAIYGASKAALNSLTESLSVELNDLNIRINALSIGAVSTEMLKQAFPEYSAPISPSQMAEYIYSFATGGYKYYNGKTLPVAITNP